MFIYLIRSIIKNGYILAKINFSWTITKGNTNNNENKSQVGSPQPDNLGPN